MNEKPVYLIDAANFDTFAGFIEECNRSFIRPFGGEWGGNLDGFNDYLYWSKPKISEYVLVWRGAEKSRQDFERESGEPGRRLYHTLVEIIRDQEHVELQLE
jgi:hypothetical protein